MLGETKINKIKLIINISLNILMIAIFLSIIIKYYIGFSEYEYIWFCSKILTLKKMIKNNNKKDKVLTHYDNGQKYTFHGKYLDFLKTISKGECISGYRKCGIIDTYGNPFCVPQDIYCPVNEMIVDSTSRLSYYQGIGYDHYTTDNSQLYLYYKQGIINNGIIVQKVIEESQPLYINEDNFVFDFDAFHECFGDSDNDNKEDDDDDDDDDDYDDDDYGNSSGDNNNNEEVDEVSKAIVEGSIEFAGSLIEDSIKLARINKLLDYIDEKIYKDENNIDYNFTSINYSNYVKNYMGFENKETAEDFHKIDFDVYKRRYPDYTSMVFAIVYLITFFGLTIYFIYAFIKEKEINNCILLIICVHYIPVFLGFWIYSIVIYARDFKSDTFEIAKKIRADKFIEDFLKEFYTHFEKSGFIIAIIILLTFSAVIFSSNFFIEKIISCIEEKRNSNSYIDNQHIENERNQQNLNNNNINYNERNQQNLNNNYNIYNNERNQQYYNNNNIYNNGRNQQYYNNNIYNNGRNQQYYNNNIYSNGRNPQYYNNNNIYNNEIGPRTTNENIQFNSDRGLNENNRFEANTNQNENNAEIKIYNERVEEQKNNENNKVQENNAAPFAGNIN